jgi:TonB family protein
MTAQLLTSFARSAPKKNFTMAQPFALSFTLHAVAVVALVFVLARPIREIVTAEPKVFSLVPPAVSASTAPGAGSGTVIVPTVQFPNLPQYAPSPVAEVMEPAPQIETVSDSAPRKISPAKRISIEEHRRLYGAPPARRIEKLVARTGPNIAKINAKDFAMPAEGGQQAMAQSIDGPAGVGEDFVARLVQELRSSYSSREAAFSGLATQIEFTLEEDGSLKNASLLKTSGSAEFDQAVLTTLRRVRLTGFPSIAVGQIFRVRFRVSSGN